MRKAKRGERGSERNNRSRGICANNINGIMVRVDPHFLHISYRSCHHVCRLKVQCYSVLQSWSFRSYLFTVYQIIKYQVDIITQRSIFWNDFRQQHRIELQLHRMIHSMVLFHFILFSIIFCFYEKRNSRKYSTIQSVKRSFTPHIKSAIVFLTSKWWKLNVLDLCCHSFLWNFKMKMYTFCHLHR